VIDGLQNIEALGAISELTAWLLCGKPAPSS
jgi:hypothetical protein